ncbi:hypothetical protein [Embleya sp. AB8]|uniref:hypothetical protein n=1 Tax=Embleya sp. AB8 TaxID=3156304 RepID=UPI003C776725
MQIKVVQRHGIDPELVAFTSSVGEGVGVWCGESTPVVDAHYDVELEVSDDLIDWR